MIIVYQSLESLGTKKDKSAGTAMAGNNFKMQAQENVKSMFGTILDFGGKGINPISNAMPGNILSNAGIKYTFHIPTYNNATNETTYEPMEVEYGSQADSKEWSENYAVGLDEASLTQKTLKDLEGIVGTIANAVLARTKSSKGLPFSRPADIIILGEIYGEEMKGKAIGDYEVMGGIDPTNDPRHRFMVLKHKLLNVSSGDIDVSWYTAATDAEKNGNNDENAICMMIKVMGWVIACVHVPNSIAKKSQAPKLAKYIENNLDRIKEEELDLLIGDTNQASANAIQKTLQKHLEGDWGNVEWISSVDSGMQEVVGFVGYDVFGLKGTNTNFKKQYDVACARHATAKIVDGRVLGLGNNSHPVFMFHGLVDKFTDKFVGSNGKALAYSDHNGVIVEILRRKDEQGLEPNVFQVILREQILEELREEQKKLAKINSAIIDGITTGELDDAERCEFCGAELSEVEIWRKRHFACPRALNRKIAKLNKKFYDGPKFSPLGRTSSKKKSR